METALDRGEPITIMEPLLIGEGAGHRPALTELAVELVAKSTGLRRSLPEGVVSALAELVRAMNCYYSNLIEGHDTHPVDIERAMRKDYSDEPRNRGELPRGDVTGIVGTGDRQARRIVSSLQDYGVITSDSTRAPLKITFPASLAGRWMPGLFPEA